MAEQHPNLKLIESFFQAYAINDSETIMGVLSPSIEWFIPGTMFTATLTNLHSFSSSNK